MLRLSGNVAHMTLLAKYTAPKEINMRLRSNGNPMCAPLVIDQANILPPTVGASMLKQATHIMPVVNKETLIT